MLRIQAFCETYGFDPAAASHFAAQYQILKSHADAYGVFCRQLEACRGDRGFDHGPVFENLHGLQETTGIHPYTIDMLYLLCLLPDLEEQYGREGIPTRFFHSFVENLKQAACNCQKIHGVWGTDIAWWLIDFFKLKLFSIGRLQFKRRKLRKEAAAFFRGRYGMEHILFGCHSWLLSPELRTILPENSNILAFARDYTILQTRMDPTSSAVSFIFHVPGVPADLETLPEETSLQKALKTYLQGGKTINTAFGILEYQ